MKEIFLVGAGGMIGSISRMIILRLSKQKQGFYLKPVEN